MNIHGNYKSQLWIFCHKEKTFTADLKFSVELNLKVSSTKDNFISLNLDSIKLQHRFNKLDLDGNIITNFFTKHINWFSKPMDWEVEKIIFKKLKAILKNLDKKLQKTLDIPALKMSLDIKFDSNPKYTDDYVQYDLDLGLTPEGEQKEFLKPKEAGKNLLADLNPREEIAIAVDDQLLDSILEVALNGHRVFNITSDSIPSELPIKINTAYFQALIPEMYEQYPNADLMIQLKLEETPKLSFDSVKESLKTNLSSILTFYLLNDTVDPLLSIATGMDINLQLEAESQDAFIHFKILEVKVNELTVLQSNWPVDADDLKYNINVLSHSMVYFINNYLRISPIPVPVIEGLKFSSVNLAIKESFLQITLTPSFNSSDFSMIKSIALP